MSMDVKILDPLQEAGWDRFILGFEGCSFFHSSGWARVLKETYGYQPVVLQATANGRVTAIFSLMHINSFLTGRRGVSMPFSDFCATLLTDRSVTAEAMQTLLEFGRERKWKYIELRGDVAMPQEDPVFARYYHHVLDLSQDSQRIFKNFRNSTQRNIKKSLNEGVTVRHATSLDAMEKFYALNCITRRRHGLPPQPFKLFVKIFEHLITKGHGFVVTAKWQDQVIAAAIFLNFGEMALYKYGASEASCQHVRANNLIMWEAIKWYCQNGYKTFSFGRTDVDHDGLLQFKRGWGAREESLPYYRIDPCSGQAMRKGTQRHRSYVKYSSKLPITALKTFGTLMYRHVG